MTPTVVASPAGVRVKITRPLTHRCPFIEETDEGTVEITWVTAAHTIELHSLAGWLGEFARHAISHEDITATIQRTLDRLPGVEQVAVATRWETAGCEVEVRGALLREPVDTQGA
jgi:NADPH-dependent 7-cyano-7-deazaguanine reductase QueF